MNELVELIEKVQHKYDVKIVIKERKKPKKKVVITDGLNFLDLSKLNDNHTLYRTGGRGRPSTAKAHFLLLEVEKGYPVYIDREHSKYVAPYKKDKENYNVKYLAYEGLIRIATNRTA
jgi:hypothetical protein